MLFPLQDQFNNVNKTMRKKLSDFKIHCLRYAVIYVDGKR